MLVAAVAVGSFAKGVTGFGGPMLAIPLASLYVGVDDAIVAIAFSAVASNVWLAWRHRHGEPVGAGWHGFLVAGGVGAVAGVALFTALDPRGIGRILAVVIVLYLLNRHLHPDMRLRPAQRRILGPPVGFASGLLQGSSGVSGPPVVMYTQAIGLDRSGFVHAVTVAFGLFGTIQLVTLGATGAYDVDRAIASVVLLAPTALFTWLGDRAARRLSGHGFDLAVEGLLVVSVVALIAKSI